jgi:hypothetical protein
MSHLPDLRLPEFKKGQPLSAADLNKGFALLQGAVEIAMHAALTPDPAGVGNEVKLTAHATRLDAIERMLAMHERQRNEKEWAPLAHVAALMQLMLEIRGPLAAKADALQEAHAEALALHADVVRRVQRLEQAPEYAMQADHQALADDCAGVAQKAHIAMVQAVALRQEVAGLRKLALGHDRLANRMEYAPLSTIGHLLQRIREIEARLPEETGK